ncbi:MAG: exopolysaccharide biosynthesis protein [Myxococcota bacterium]|nr:exopolysaccharide biosynthesis protein [Myxococcota bacterium]
MSQTSAIPDTRLSAELNDFLEQLEGKDSTVNDLVNMIGDRGFGLLILLLALPAALPIPAVGYGTPFGILLITLGAQIALGREAPWVPRKLGTLRVPYKLLSFSIKNARFPLRAVELFIRPRLSGLASHRIFLPGVGVMIMLLAAMMSMPIPLTNTAPSFVIFMLAAGILEEDGLFLLFGLLLAPVAAAIAGAAVYYAFTYGPEAVETILKPEIKQLLGLE